MKVQAKAKGLTVTMSMTEAERIVTLCRDADSFGPGLPDEDLAMLAALSSGAAQLRHLRAGKQAQRDIARRSEALQRGREAYGTSGDFNWTASRSDYADTSRNPDWRLWTDIFFEEAMNRPLPDQCEIRRDVWLVRVTYRAHDPYANRTIVGMDCTTTADRHEITEVVDRIIATATVRA